MTLRLTIILLVAACLLGIILALSLLTWGPGQLRSALEERGVAYHSASYDLPSTLVLRDVHVRKRGLGLQGTSLRLQFALSPLPHLRGIRVADLRVHDAEVSAAPWTLGPEEEGLDLASRLSSALERVPSLEGILGRVEGGLSLIRPHLRGDLHLEVDGLALGDGPVTPLKLVAALPMDPQGTLRANLSLGGDEGSLSLAMAPREGWWRLEGESLFIPEGLIPTLDGQIQFGEAPILSLMMVGTLEGVEGTFALDLEALTLKHPLLSTAPLGPLDLEFGGDCRLDAQTRRLSLEPLGGTFGDAPFQGSLEVSGDGVIDVALSLGPKARGEDLLRAFPTASIPALRGLKVEGPLSLMASLRGNLEEPETLRLTVSGDGQGLRLLEGHLGQKLGAYPLEGRVHAPVDAEGRSHVMVLSRSAPGWTPLQEIHPALIAAVIVAEDGYFYAHQGVDPRAIAAAFEANVAGGRGLRGGSTLTQQLAKNLFLSPSRTLMRKVQEVALAWELERRMPKSQILETYLNIIEWGPGVYGVFDAAAHYFGKVPMGLSLKESAFLASIIPGPRRYHAYHLEGALSPRWDARVGEILHQMALLGHITSKDAKVAQSEGLTFTRAEGERGEGGLGGDENPWR